MIVLKKVKSKEQLRDIQMEEMEKERLQMEDAVGFSNLINFLSQSVSFYLKFRGSKS